MSTLRPSFKVLMVCSGNICRSPIAEQLMRAKTLGLPVTVSSAGVIAKEGAAMTEEAALVSRRFGGEPETHRARQLTLGCLRDIDFVLTATRAHRSSVVQLMPRLSTKAFTISEFVRLVGTLPGPDVNTLPDMAALVDGARSLRGFVEPPNDPVDDDIEDPYGKSMEVYETVGQRIDTEIALIAKMLRVSSNPTRGPLQG